MTAAEAFETAYAHKWQKLEKPKGPWIGGPKGGWKQATDDLADIAARFPTEWATMRQVADAYGIPNTHAKSYVNRLYAAKLVERDRLPDKNGFPSRYYVWRRAQ